MICSSVCPFLGILPPSAFVQRTTSGCRTQPPSCLIFGFWVNQMESVMAKKVRGYRRYPVGMKQQVVGRMEAGENVKALARELGIDRTLLYVRKRKGAGQPYGSAAGQVQEVDFFAAALRGIAALRRQKSGSGERASTEKSADAPKRKAK